jgi:hypothetical protein
MSQKLCIYHVMVLQRKFKEFYGDHCPLELIRVIMGWFCELHRAKKYDDVDFSQIVFGEIIKKDDLVTHSVAKILYTNDLIDNKLIINTNVFRVNMCDPAIYLFYYDRIRIVFDQYHPECVALWEHLKKADDYFWSDPVKSKFFGVDASKFLYCPLAQTRPNLQYCLLRIYFGPDKRKVIIKQNGKEVKEINSVKAVCEYLGKGCEISIQFAYDHLRIPMYGSTSYGVILFVTEINKICDETF